MSKNILITGAAGFIGFHLANKLIKNGNQVIGVDNINPYYDIKLKKQRLKIISKKSNREKKKLEVYRNRPY